MIKYESSFPNTVESGPLCLMFPFSANQSTQCHFLWIFSQNINVNVTRIPIMFHGQNKFVSLSWANEIRLYYKEISSISLIVHKLENSWEENIELFSARLLRSQRKQSCTLNNHNRHRIIPPWRKISAKSVFFASPWTHSNLIKGGKFISESEKHWL